MKRKLILIRKKSEKRRLVHEVRFLCDALKRPVSSADLRRHFKIYPDRRPHLLQRFGQLLIKAARPVPEPIPRIHPIGMYGNKVFYAPDSRSLWKERFERHILRETILSQFRSGFLDHVTYLIHSPYEKLAKNAVAGWIFELEASLKKCRDRNFPEYKEIIAALKEAKGHSSKRYVCKKPKLISRAQASKMLLQEFHRRNPDFEKDPSLSRYLSRLRWPQSTLFLPTRVPRYYEKQVRSFVAARWPMENEDPLLFRSLEFALRYGR